MKKYIALLMALLMVLALCGCGANNQDGRGTMSAPSIYDKAIIKLPDENVITVEVKSWCTACSNDQICVTDKNGYRYLTDIENCVLIKEGGT